MLSFLLEFYRYTLELYLYTSDKPNTAGPRYQAENKIVSLGSGNTILATFIQIRHAFSTYCVHVTSAQGSKSRPISNFKTLCVSTRC